MKINDLVHVTGELPVTVHNYSVWRITLIAVPYAVIEIVKPYDTPDHRWIGELAQVRLDQLKLFKGII